MTPLGIGKDDGQFLIEIALHSYNLISHTKTDHLPNIPYQATLLFHSKKKKLTIPQFSTIRFTRSITLSLIKFCMCNGILFFILNIFWMQEETVSAHHYWALCSKGTVWSAVHCQFAWGCCDKLLQVSVNRSTTFLIDHPYSNFNICCPLHLSLSIKVYSDKIHPFNLEGSQQDDSTPYKSQLESRLFC